MAWPNRTGPRLPDQVRQAVLHRHPTCTLRIDGICTGQSTEVDHIRNRATGGTDHPHNLRGVCTACHKIVTQQQAIAGQRARRARQRLPEAAHPGTIEPTTTINRSAR